MRTLAALLAFFAIFVIAWQALVLVGVAVLDWQNVTNEAALGLVLFVAPVVAFFSAIACGTFLIAPRQSRSSR